MIDLTRRLGPNTRDLLAVTALAVLTLGIGLGGSGRLTYHEAIAAQAARRNDRLGRLGRSHPWWPPLAGKAAVSHLVRRFDKPDHRRGVRDIRPIPRRRRRPVFSR